MATSGTGMLTGTTTGTTQDLARRGWPRWAALGVALLGLAVVALVWRGTGAHLLLGAAGVAGVVRGGLIVRASRLGMIQPPAQPLGAVTAALGAGALAVAAVPGAAAGRVLAVGVPVLLLAVAGALTGRGGGARRGGVVLLVWSLLVTALLVVAAVSGGWSAAAGAATVVAALCAAVLGVRPLVVAADLRATASRPAPPAAPAGCGGCACGAGGCGAALGG